MVAAVLDDATPPTRLDLLNCGFSAEYFFKSVECLRPSSPCCLKMQIEDWLQLDQMVRDSIDNFKRMWRERAAHRRSQTDWATTEVLTKGGKSFKKEIDEEDLMPGSIVKVALGERVRSVSVYITNGGNTRMRPKSRSEWRRKLCKVLVDVCLLNGSSKVNPSAIKETTNHLSYLQLEVHGNRTFVGNALQWREIGFVIEIKGRENELVKKYFAINLHSQRFRRSSCSKFCTGTVSGESSNFPDYDQHRCCGDCWSGCSPVAWAQVFGYYDRLAHSFSSSKFSSWIFEDRYTMAPLKMTYAVRAFVEDIRSQVQTHCTSEGEGATYTTKEHLIAPWFRARQARARVVSYLDRRIKTSVAGARVECTSRSEIQSKGVAWLKKDYPVFFGFPVEGGGHSAVATKYREKVRSYRHCTSRQTGWWLGKKTKSVCSWRSAYDYEFYLHYGWGGRNNGWRTINPWDAHVAYLN